MSKSRGVLKGRDFFFFLLRTPLKDSPKGPPTANRQLPSTANRHQPPPTTSHQPPPTASGGQPPTANHCQLPPTTNRQPPTAANHHQPPPTASCQLPTANRRQPPTANCHQPWLSTWSARGLFWETGTLFFFPLRTPLSKSHQQHLAPPQQKTGTHAPPPQTHGATHGPAHGATHGPAHGATHGPAHGATHSDRGSVQCARSYTLHGSRLDPPCQPWAPLGAERHFASSPIRHRFDVMCRRVS